MSDKRIGDGQEMNTQCLCDWGASRTSARPHLEVVAILRLTLLLPLLLILSSELRVDQTLAVLLLFLLLGVVLGLFLLLGGLVVTALIAGMLVLALLLWAGFFAAFLLLGFLG